jgi:hypothetical protein
MDLPQCGANIMHLVHGRSLLVLALMRRANILDLVLALIVMPAFFSRTKERRLCRDYSL